MKLSITILLSVLSVTSVLEARALIRRQVPQEHSHEALLIAMREIVPVGTPSIQGDGNLPDVVFALLGNQAAGNAAPTKGTAGAICLQQDFADTAISRAAGDNKKIGTALKFRALERNAASVGGKSDLCTKKPKNTILEGLTQHQDAAGAGAVAFNKNVEITLAGKLASLGIDPLEALETATFGPGNINDLTGKGLTCDDANDKVGCIFTQKLNVPAATEAELKAAGSGIKETPVKFAVAAAPPVPKVKAGAAGGESAAKIIDSMVTNLEQLKAICKV